MTRTTRRGLRGAAALLAAVALAACAGPPGGAGPGPHAGPGAHDAPRGDAPESPSGSPEPAGAQPLPSAHVHGVGINPGDGLVYLATHDGLFRYGPAGPERVGAVNDLMGFTIAGPDHFYASGHPGPGSDLPNPVGLVESTDAGRT